MMLQWMGGSRRKVDTSRRSTQKRQKQYFEQRKRREQQKKDARESFFEEKSPCNQQEKNSRSLDILSLLNISTGSGDLKSNVHSARHMYEDNQMPQPSPVIQTSEVFCLGSLQHKEGTSPSSQDYAACPKNTLVGASGGHESALYRTDEKVNPLTNSTSKQLSIIDILGDDGPNCELENSAHEGHVAFSIEGIISSLQDKGGLGKIEMSTPVHSPQVPVRPLSYGRSSPPRTRRKALSSEYLNRGIGGIELELDSMMVDVELPFRTSPLDGSACSRGIPDLPGSAEHKLLDTKWFSFNNNFTDLYTFESDEFFGKSKESSNTIWNGLGKIEMSTPVHSPQVPVRPLSYGRSSPPRTRRKALSSEYLNRGIGGIELELDSMMVDVELPFRTSPLDGSACSRGIPDLPGSAEHKLLDTKWFSFNNNFTDLYTFESDEFFGKSKESSNTIWNDSANSSFQLPESFHEDCGSPHKSYLYHFDAGSTDLWNNQSCGMREFNFEDCYYWGSVNSSSARNYGKQDTYFDDSYHQKQRVRMRAKSEFNIIDSATPYSKHYKSENFRDFSVSDGEWCSMRCTNPHLMDNIDHADKTWFANEDARDNLSLLSKESSTAVVGELDRQQKMNSNNKRRSQDVSDGSKETKFCEKLSAKERNCKRNDIQQGKEMDEPTKLPWPPNQSSAKPEYYHPVFYEKRSDMNNDGIREARCGPGESNLRFRSFYETSVSKRHVSTCSNFSTRDVLTDREPKLQVDSLQNLKGSIKYPGEYAPSCFMFEPMTFELDSPRCTFRNLFQDDKKGWGTEDSLHTLGSQGKVTGNIVRDVGKIPDFPSDGHEGVDILPFDSGQFVPNIEVSGRCKGLSSRKEKSTDGSSSVNKCSNCEEPKEKTPEVEDRTRSFNYSERAEEASSSIEISTVSKGDQHSSDKNQDTQSSLRCQAGDEADSRSSSKEGRIATRQSHNVHQNGQVMMLEAVSFNFYVCSF